MPDNSETWKQRALLAEAERDGLRKALEPFADVASEGNADHPDDTRATVTAGRTTYYALTLGDFRRAAALATPSPSDADQGGARG